MEITAKDTLKGKTKTHLEADNKTLTNTYQTVLSTIDGEINLYRKQYLVQKAKNYTDSKAPFEYTKINLKKKKWIFNYMHVQIKNLGKKLNIENLYNVITRRQKVFLNRETTFNIWNYSY